MWAMPGTTFGLGFALKESLQERDPAIAKTNTIGVDGGHHSWMAPNAGIRVLSDPAYARVLASFSHEFKAMAYDIAGTG